ncbi:MAG: hypothetical protein QMD03_07695 [Syntrophales bacterium]|nr:hypothetical protein [Syntrophales bacterium]
MKLKLTIAVGIMMGVFFLLAGIGFCEEKVSMSEWTEIVQKMGDKGSINWSAGYIEAIGIGAPPQKLIGTPQVRPMALRAAKMDAYRNLLEIIKGVQINSETLVKDFVVESDIIRSQIEGLVKGAQVVNQDYLSDGTVEVTVRMPIYGDFSRAVLSRIMERRPEIVPPVAPAVKPPAVPQVTAPETPSPAAIVYTGMVIDARGIQARPAMSPKIIDEDGKEVYGSMQVDREYAVQQGISGYARDLTAAQSNPRVTNNPVTVKGLKIEGPGRSDIVISNADATNIRAATDNLSFMKKCRVMIVLD